MKMLRVIKGLDSWWIPSDVRALNEEGPEGKWESVMKDIDELLCFFPSVKSWRGGWSFYSTVFAPSSSGRAGTSLYFQCQTNCSEVEVGLYGKWEYVNC
jgi:hypothetical protein